MSDAERERVWLNQGGKCPTCGADMERARSPLFIHLYICSKGRFCKDVSFYHPEKDKPTGWNWPRP